MHAQEALQHGDRVRELEVLIRIINKSQQNRPFKRKSLKGPYQLQLFIHLKAGLGQKDGI
jgi:hypothetical protein